MPGLIARDFTRDAVVRRMELPAGVVLVVSPPPGEIWSRPIRDAVLRSLVNGGEPKGAVMVLAEPVDAAVWLCSPPPEPIVNHEVIWE